MADKTLIEWTDATWNPITGCSVVSPGCTNCYAMKLAGTRLKHHPSRAGLTSPTRSGPVWNGEVRLNKDALHQPPAWKRGRRVFVCAHGDLFHDKVPDDWILDVFTVMAVNPHHHFQVLTKRPHRAAEFLDRAGLLDAIYANWYGFSGGPREVRSWPLHNVWIGASAEDQRRYDERRAHIEGAGAAVRFWSLEPLLGPIDMKFGRHKPDWVIVGGETQKGARPMHPDWVRSIRDQCAAAGVAFFFKQWGSWKPRRLAEADDLVDARRSLILSPNGSTTSGLMAYPQDAWLIDHLSKKAAGRMLDGAEHNAMPEVRHVA